MDASGRPRMSRQLLNRLMSNHAANAQTYGTTRMSSANRTHNVDRQYIKGYGDSMSANSSIGSSQRVGGNDASSGSGTAMDKIASSIACNLVVLDSPLLALNIHLPALGSLVILLTRKAELSLRSHQFGIIRLDKSELLVCLIIH